MVDKKFKESIDTLLQKKINFYILTEGRKNVLKKGQFLNYKFKMPFFYFQLKMDNEKIREVCYPHPFDYDITDNGVLFNYQIKEISFNEQKILDMLLKLPYNSDSKLYNTILYIEEFSE